MTIDKTHNYKTTIKWTGNKSSGTSHYEDQEREHLISIENKKDILGSSDPAFRGDKTKHNPEDLLYLRYPPVICFGIYIYAPKQEL